MRVSADACDPDWIGRENFGRYMVLLNGQPVKRCFIASEEHRYIVTAQVDKDGHLLIDKKREQVYRQVEYGEVLVIDRRAHGL